MKKLVICLIVISAFILCACTNSENEAQEEITTKLEESTEIEETSNVVKFRVYRKNETSDSNTNIEVWFEPYYYDEEYDSWSYNYCRFNSKGIDDGYYCFQFDTIVPMSKNITLEYVLVKDGAFKFDMHRYKNLEKIYVVELDMYIYNEFYYKEETTDAIKIELYCDANPNIKMFEVTTDNILGEYGKDFRVFLLTEDMNKLVGFGKKSQIYGGDPYWVVIQLYNTHGDIPCDKDIIAEYIFKLEDLI